MVTGMESGVTANQKELITCGDCGDSAAFVIASDVKTGSHFYGREIAEQMESGVTANHKEQITCGDCGCSAAFVIASDVKTRSHLYGREIAEQMDKSIIANHKEPNTCGEFVDSAAFVIGSDIKTRNLLYGREIAEQLDNGVGANHKELITCEDCVHSAAFAIGSDVKTRSPLCGREIADQMDNGVIVNQEESITCGDAVDSAAFVIGSDVPDRDYTDLVFGIKLQRCDHKSDNPEQQEFLQLQPIPLPQSPGQAEESMIKKYLMSNEAWEVPSSVLYEEPATCVTQYDLSTCPDVTADEIEEPDKPNVFPEDCSLQAKARKRGGRRHKGHFMKRPMATSEVIEELQDYDLRENALRCLSGHLIERREEDPEFYRQAGFFLFHSCGTVAILLQEILVIYDRFNAGDLNVRGSKRLANVLCLLQSIAANKETRIPFLRSCIPNYLFPFILSEYTEEVYENVRIISLSVIAIVCQAREKETIRWALENDIIEICFHALDVGSELSKVLSMTILDSILRVDEGLSAMCETLPNADLLPKFIMLCGDLISVLAVIQGFSPRLLFLVVRSYILLCQNYRALEMLRDQLPSQLQDTTFRDFKMEFPLFGFLRHQLLLSTGKATDYLPSVVGSLEPSPATPSDEEKKNRGDNSSSGKLKQSPNSATICVTPMRPIDFSNREWPYSPTSRLENWHWNFAQPA